MRDSLVAIGAALLLVHSAPGLDPAKSFSQYVHDSWNSDNGFPGGAVYAICQSQDGYLWIGTERGLVRFDGFQFKLIQHPIPSEPVIGPVRGLVLDEEGNLWIRVDGPRLLVYREGGFKDAAAQYGLEEVAFTAMSLDSDGHLILWGFHNRTLRFRGGQFTRTGESSNLPGTVISMSRAADGKLWMGTRDVGLYSVDQRRRITVLDNLPLASVNALVQRESDLWIGTDDGLYSSSGVDLKKQTPASPLRHVQVLSLAADREGTLWVGTVRGLYRMTSSRGPSPESMNSGSGAETAVIYADRDGDIWYGGLHGIERLRDGVFTEHSRAQGLPAENNGPVFVDRDGRTWFAPATGGVYWLKDGRVGKIDADHLEHDVVYSISGGDGEIWIGREHGGLTRLTKSGNSWVAQSYTHANGLAQNSVTSVHRNRDGTVWAGTVSGGISMLKDGVFADFSAVNGPKSNAIFSIVEAKNGTMWFATPNGLESYSKGIWTNFSLADGLPSPNIRSIFEDSQQVLWIATAAGLAFSDGGRIKSVESQIDLLHEEILGLTEDRAGNLWIVTPDHVLQVNRETLLRGRLRDADVSSYGLKDGLPGVEGVRRDRSVITDQDGRIWLSLDHGLANTDAPAEQRRREPVAARVESIEAAGAQVSALDSPRLPAGTRSVVLNFASTNLSAPERVKFRYRLDGTSPQWSEDVQTRQVIYTNLEPGTYRFHILASSVSGVWDGPDTTYTFVIEPAFWQVWWFQISCMVASALLIVFVYRWRLAALTHRLNERFQDRLAERARIAQDLHDTLLQGVLSAQLQLDLVEEQTPPESLTKSRLRRVLELLQQVTEEGRNALRGLRGSGDGTPNLEISLSRLADEFPRNEQLVYRVIVQGVAEPLQSTIRDDVYRIAREAVINALRHAEATNIEVEVEYAAWYFRLLVRDDGRGIDPAILQAGRVGHWGLSGMRERSEHIQSVLKLRSRLGTGTEIELTVPGVIAFGRSSPSGLWDRFCKLAFNERQKGNRKGNKQ